MIVPAVRVAPVRADDSVPVLPRLPSVSSAAAPRASVSQRSKSLPRYNRLTCKSTTAILQERPTQNQLARTPARVAVPRQEAPPADGGLPRRYDQRALEEWCAQRPHEMNRRWANFLRITVPFMARVGASFSLGAIEREEVTLARELCRTLSQLGPTFVKLGQLLSSRPDLLSPGVAAELSRLQSDVEPFSDAAAMKALEAELGRPIDDVFDELDSCNVAAASLSQVYRGRLRSGEVVAVKVQRPDALSIVAQDLVILKRGLEYYKGSILALWRDMGIASSSLSSGAELDELLDTWAGGFYSELDFSLEGHRQAAFRDALMGAVPHCHVPAVHASLCTRRLLVSEWVSGIKITACSPNEVAHLTGVAARCFCFQLLELGQFHGDPHAGNMLRLEGEGGGPPRLCLIDFGLVAEVPAEARAALASGMVHLTECNWPRWIDTLVELDVLDEATLDRPRVEALSDRMLRPFVTGGGGSAAKIAERLDTAQLLADLSESADIRVRTPPYFALLSRAVSILEGVALAVDPTFSLLSAAAPLAAQWLLATEQRSDGRAPDSGRRAETAAEVLLVTSLTSPPTPERAQLATWVLTSDSRSARATLLRVLRAAEPPKEGRQPLEPSLTAPLRFLALAKLATSMEHSTRGSDDGHPCPEVHRAFRFLLQSSTPQVKEQVVTQAARAADLCSRYIMQGVDVPTAEMPTFIGTLPNVLQGAGQLALDAVFPPLDPLETEQARALVVVAVNTLGVRDMEELQELLVPWAMLKGLRDGTPVQHLQRLMDTAVVGHPTSAGVFQDVFARMSETYVSRLRL